jgi:hypothetical protein
MVIQLVNGRWICKTAMRCYAFIQLAFIAVAVVDKFIADWKLGGRRCVDVNKR